MTDLIQDQDKTFKWGEITVTPADVPVQSLFALAQRGFSHVLGNEVAAQVSTWKKTDEGKNADERAIEAYAKSKRDEKLAKILDGTLGVRIATGPRVSGIEALMRSIAVEFLRKRLDAYSKKTGSKVTLPTKDNTITVAGKVMTREQLVEAELRKSGDAIRAEAERRQSADLGDGDADELFSE